MRTYFKGIKSTEKSECGRSIRSGQLVEVYGRASPLGQYEVEFEPNHGFKINGNNLTDSFVTRVIKQPSLADTLRGNIDFLIYSLFGK